MILRELVLAIAGLVDLAFSIYIFILIARALVSWVNPDPYNPIVRFLHTATDPLMSRVQRLIPLQFGGIDFTPLALLLALSFCQRIITAVLRSIAYSF
jgi:YggT family protein